MGGFASDLLAQRSGGGFASSLLAERNTPPEVQATPEGLDAEAEAAEPPSYGYESGPEKPASIPGESALSLPQLPEVDPNGSRWDTLSDAVTGTAEGAYKGLGLTPEQMFGDRTRNQIRAAHKFSPAASGVGKFVGEAGIQTLAAPEALAASPVAMGAAGGFLSGVGNTDAGLKEKLNAGKGGAVLGGITGGIAGTLTGKASNAVERKLPELEESQATHGLMNGGATVEDLAGLDDLGGRVDFYNRGRELGISGKPAAMNRTAQSVVNEAEAGRKAIESSRPGLTVDPNYLGAAIEAQGGRKLPNIQGGASQPLRNVVQREADAARQMGGPQGAPWEDVNGLRQYWGDKANFGKDTPEAVARQGIHGGINDVLGQALGPSGDQWRQLGQNEHVGIELRDIAKSAMDRGRAKGLTPGDIGTGGALPLLNSNRHAIAEQGYNTARKLGNAVNFVSEWGTGAPAAASGTASGMVTGQSGTLVDTALNSLAAGGAELGDYRDQFAQAASSPDHGAISNLITRLTMSDPKFRTQLLPRLRQMGGM